MAHDPRERPWQDAYADELEAELARWRRHGVLITVDCRNCDATGWVKDDPEFDDPDASLSGCPECHVTGVGGTGKALRDGVKYLNPSAPHSLVKLTFPASWLEGDSDG